MALDPRLWAIIRQYAPRYGLDPRAVAAVAMNESGGRFGAAGDRTASGIPTSFGPWQLHVGGALPAGKGARWANSLPGILYTFRQMASSGARGLRGPAAVSAIARGFERPADPGAEIRTALGYYRQPGFARGSAVAGMGGGGVAGGGGGAARTGGVPGFALQLHPIQVAPAAPMASALTNLQNLLASRSPATAPTLEQAPGVAFPASGAPGPSQYLDQLSAVHDRLLKL